MARIAGVTLPKQKRIEIALTYMYGIGISRARKIIHEAGLDANKKVSDLTEQEENALRLIIEKN